MTRSAPLILTMTGMLHRTYDLKKLRMSLLKKSGCKKLMNWWMLLSLKIKDKTTKRNLIQLTKSLGPAKQVIKETNTRTDKITISEAKDPVSISDKVINKVNGSKTIRGRTSSKTRATPEEATITKGLTMVVEMTFIAMISMTYMVRIVRTAMGKTYILIINVETSRDKDHAMK